MKRKSREACRTAGSKAYPVCSRCGKRRHHGTRRYADETIVARLESVLESADHALEHYNLALETLEQSPVFVDLEKTCVSCGSEIARLLGFKRVRQVEPYLKR